MKKIILVLGPIILIIILVIAWGIYVSFTSIKPTTEEIDKDLEAYFSKTFQIPSSIPRPSRDLESVKYQWEMETLSKEISAVELTYTPSFFKDEETITANLKMTQNGDPSLFIKVLPAIITDPQSIKTAQDPQKGDYNPNPQAGYHKLEVALDPKNNQTIEIKWDYEKDKLPSEIKSKYQKLEKYPKPLLKIFYAIPGFLINLARG